MKTFALIVVAAGLSFIFTGCCVLDTTEDQALENGEKVQYYLGGSMDEQVQSWQNVPGGRR
ncbi:hypothetical protein [Pontiella sp.]|uniref:hypothetical protein n=1 Tax=Pontiella sp. TaxID=2837462 RepID=UPI00356B044D